MWKECNPGKQDPGTHLEDKRESPSIYVGESSRSLFERSKEHQRDYRKNSEDSHMAKHWLQFIQKVIQICP